MTTDALERAIAIVGGQSRLAAQVNQILAKSPDDPRKPKPIRQGSIWSWLNRTKVIPAEYVIPIETATGGIVSRHDLRSDIYPRGSAA